MLYNKCYVMTLKEFNNKYQYKTDKDKFGFFEVWEIIK